MKTSDLAENRFVSSRRIACSIIKGIIVPEIQAGTICGAGLIRRIAIDFKKPTDTVRG
jgi:hypothetical protein